MRRKTSWHKPVEIRGSLVVACCVYGHEVSSVALRQASASSFATRVETSWAAALSTSMTWHWHPTPKPKAKRNKPDPRAVPVHVPPESLRCQLGFQLVLLGSDIMVIIFSLCWCFINQGKNLKMIKYNQIYTTISKSIIVYHTFIISTTSFWVFSNTGFFLAHTHTYNSRPQRNTQIHFVRPEESITRQAHSTNICCNPLTCFSASPIFSKPTCQEICIHSFVFQKQFTFIWPYCHFRNMIDVFQAAL